jgi:DNA helicase-2/ATP-dependent DNA helicase PcrA
MTQGAFPVEGKDAKGWLAAGKIPFELRADGASLPVFDYQSAQTQKQLNESFNEFKELNRKRALSEERRLAYVAFTRAAKKLTISGSYFKGSAQSPKAPSMFLEELSEAGLINLEIPEPLDKNPLDATKQVLTWPSHASNPELELQAQSVLTATPAKTTTSHELALLFEERDRLRTPQSPELPKRISVSRLVKLLSEPETFFNDLARPMPPSFSQAAAVGTAFHSFLEAVLLEQEVAESRESFTELVGNFEKSKFHGNKPVLVEQAIEFQLAGLVVACKLDAVFQDGEMYEVVDWKTGSVPDDSELESRKIQLALYRIALSKWLGVPVERIRASFFYAGSGTEISPTGLPSQAELEDRIRAARTARPD